MGTVIKTNKKDFRRKGFGFVYVKGITDENEVIKGGSLFAFNKQILTLAVADTLWVDDYGESYGLKLEGSVLFMWRIALGVGKRGA